MRATFLLRWIAATALLALAGPAAAQATRTWVSGVGDDANPCSRTAPCSTWAGALAKTASGGEIDALDPGDFGPVFITRSITLDGGHSLAGIDATGSAVVVNAGATDVVVLRNLRLQGVASPSAPPAGVVFGSGAQLRVQRVSITGFAVGIDFRPAAGGLLDAHRVRIADCVDAGIEVASGDPSTPGRATLSQVQLVGGRYGLLVTDNGSATLIDGVVSRASLAALAAVPSMAGDAELNIQDVVLSGDALGIAAQAATPGQAIVRLSRLTSLDAVPTAHVGTNGDIRSFGDNRLVAGPDFSLGVDPPAAQVNHGASATFTVAVTAEGISPGAVTLECQGLPAHARCAFNPATVSPTGSPVASTLTISTDDSTASVLAASQAGRGGAAGGSGLALSLLLAVLAGVLDVLGQRRAWALSAAGLLVLSVAVACNGGGGGGSHEVAPGTYAVVVRATAGVVVHEASVSLEVR